jgi:pyruvate ferredoxin oxidoreductase alpha subunit
MEMRLRQQEAFARVFEAHREIEADWAARFGRTWGAIEADRVADAEVVLVTSGTVTSTARHVVNERRARGEKVGLLKVKMFRPFPTAALRAALAPAPRVAVLDRNLSPGRSGIFAEEIRAALYDLPGRRPRIDGYVIGLGGRDVTPATIEECLERTRAARPSADGTSAAAGIAAAALAPNGGPREDIWVGVKS